MLLTVKDYEKLIQLLSQLHSYENDIRPTILKTLQELFKDYSMAFFLTDENEQFVNPVSINISSKIMDIYEKYYYKTDIFHTTNIEKRLLQKNIIQITDIMPLSTFENTEFYNDLLRKMGVFDEIALPLNYGNRLMGIIGIMKPISNGKFTEKEIQCANIIRNNIIPCLKEYLDKVKAQQERSLLLNCTEEAPIGIIVFDSKFKVMNYNQSACRFVKEISGKDSDNQPFEYLIKILLEKLYSQSLNFNNSLYTSIKDYTFKIVPFAVHNLTFGFSTFYTVYISRNHDNNYIDYNRLETLFNLTNRECQIVYMLSQGYSNNRIADELYLSNHTIKTHIQNIFKKMKSSSRTEVLHKVNEMNQKGTGFSIIK